MEQREFSRRRLSRTQTSALGEGHQFLFFEQRQIQPAF